MKKEFNSYLAAWGICLVIFNVAAFVAPNEFDGSFFVGYLFITFAFVGQLFCAKLAFNRDNVQKFFYNIPLVSISLIGLVIMLLFGGLSMTIPRFPVWLGIIICFTVLGVTAIAVIGASQAGEVVAKIDQKVSANTMFIKMLTADAEILMTKAESHNKTVIGKVYEILRFSDPVSNSALASTEAQIATKFEELKNAVISGTENIGDIADELIILIADRNTKCKLLK